MIPARRSLSEATTPITVCRFYTLCHFLCERRATPPSLPPALARELYLADDLLRAHSSEVSACRGRFNDVGGWLADSLRRLFRGPLLFKQWYGVLKTESHFFYILHFVFAFLLISAPTSGLFTYVVNLRHTNFGVITANGADG